MRDGAHFARQGFRTEKSPAREALLPDAVVVQIDHPETEISGAAAAPRAPVSNAKRGEHSGRPKVGLGGPLVGGDRGENGRDLRATLEQQGTTASKLALAQLQALEQQSSAVDVAQRSKYYSLS